MKRAAAVVVLLACLSAFVFQVPAFGALNAESLRGTELFVYNWGEYISDGSEGSLDVNKAFEEKYGIKVVYDTFDNNEVMYTKLKGGGVSYDVVIPSDYMIERMVSENMLQTIDFANVPNYKYIDAKYKNLPFDPNNEYSVPYNVGTIGLIYNTKKVAVAPDSWDALWNPDYAGQILMINNPRDAFAIAHAILGIDCNTTDKADWEAGAQKLK
ncbi:MAG TPA: spermidine/putrescine ABC transporter substrate-binding protein, partial [Clostridiales bacterium]|nr:spermidine/putrescine ABC transporter substrate-binding protein [Clostridiales bacterium]